jgi:uncharacterized protein (TIGR03437 family)
LEANTQAASFQVVAGATDTQQSITITAAAFGQTASTAILIRASARPTIVAPDSVSVSAGETVQFTVSATDPSNSRLTLGAENLPGGATFSTSSGVFLWPTTTELSGTYSVTFTATNSSNVTVRKTTTIRVAAVRAGVAGIFNAASIVRDGGCSPGALASIWGTGLTTQPPQQAGELPLPTQLAGVRVLTNGSPSPILYASSTLIHFQCPFDAPGTALKVDIESEDGSLLPALDDVMKEATPGLYTIDMSGTGQGAGLVANTTDLAMVRTAGLPSRPAQPGEYISIYANGLGPLKGDRPSPAPGMPAPYDTLFTARPGVRVIIGEIEVEPAFVGLSPGSVSLFQINVRVPENVIVGPKTPVLVKVILVDGTVLTANPITIAIEAVE